MNAIEQRNRELEAEIDGIKRWQQDQRCGAQVRGDATITAITCSGDTMRLSCAARGGRIVVTSAHYGRTATGTGRPCVGADTLVADLPPPRDDAGGRESLPFDPTAAYSGDKDFLLVDNLTCSLRCDSILRQRVDATCNGRQLCEVNVSTRALGGWDPCKRVLPSGKLCTVRKYLNVTYVCARDANDVKAAVHARGPSPLQELEQKWRHEQGWDEYWLAGQDTYASVPPADALPAVQVVVCRFNEDIGWLRQLHARAQGDLHTIVYNKQGNARSSQRLAEQLYNTNSTGAALQADQVAIRTLCNVGKEAFCFLQHIIERWRDLAEVTVFLQGDPFPHFEDDGPVARGPDHPMWHALEMRSIASGRNAFVGLGGLDYIVKEPSGCPDQCGVALNDHFHAVFGRPMQDETELPIPFKYGGQFAVGRERIRSRPLAFYKRLKRLVEWDVDPWGIGWALETLWGRIFGHERTSFSDDVFHRPTYEHELE